MVHSVAMNSKHKIYLRVLFYDNFQLPYLRYFLLYFLNLWNVKSINKVIRTKSVGMKDQLDNIIFYYAVSHGAELD